jgi:hypothetical protein
MAGYSGSGTARKLGIKPGMTVVVVDAPVDWTIADLSPAVEMVRWTAGQTGALPAPATVVAFFQRNADFEAAIGALARLVWPATALWAAWPRRAGGHTSDLTDNSVRTTALRTGLVDVKVAAIDEDWSGLRFLWRKELRDRPPAPV